MCGAAAVVPENESRRLADPRPRTRLADAAAVHRRRIRRDAPCAAPRGADPDGNARRRAPKQTAFGCAQRGAVGSPRAWFDSPFSHRSPGAARPPAGTRRHAQGSRRRSRLTQTARAIAADRDRPQAFAEIHSTGGAEADCLQQVRSPRFIPCVPLPSGALARLCCCPRF